MYKFECSSTCINKFKCINLNVVYSTCINKFKCINLNVVVHVSINLNLNVVVHVYSKVSGNSSHKSFSSE